MSKNAESFAHRCLQLAKEAADLGVWEWNIDENTLIWDDRTIELFGSPPEGGVEEFIKRVHPEDREAVRNDINEAAKEGASFDHTYRIQVNGRTRWIEAHGTWMNEESSERRLIGTVKDVTDDLTRKTELERFKRTIDNIPEEIYVIDSDTARILDVTEQVEHTLGYSREQLLSMQMHDINPDLSSPLNWDKLADRIIDNGPVTVETQNQCKDGTTYPVEMKADYSEIDGHERIVITCRNLTDRKEAEQEQTRFKQAVEASGHGVLITDDRGVITYVNSAFEKMSGYSRTKLEGATPNILNSGEHDEEFFQELWETITSGDVWRAEVINRRASGELFYVQQTISPVLNDEGEIESFIAVQEDITEKKEREQELMVKDRAIDNSPVGIVLTDASTDDNPICYVNDGFLRLTGYDREEVLGRNCRFLQGQETDPQTVQRLRTAIDKDEPVEVDIRNYRANGEMFWNHLIITPIRNEEGEVTHFIGYQEDITERKEMETSLRKSEKRYRTLFEEANEAFLIESFDDRVLDANQAACDMLGYSRDELSGMDLERITPDEIIDECGDRGIVEYHLDQHGGSLYNWHYLHSDGSTIPVEKSKTPIEYEGSRAVLVCIRDRTELERIRKRDQRKSSFVSQVTHDLRTPLNSITGMGDLLMDTDLSGQQQSYLQTILNASRNMERLTNDILDLNRIERAELILDEEPFNMQRLLGEVISLYSQEVNERDVMLSTQVSEDVAEQLVGDPDRIKQILHNLVDNAIKHTRDGSITIEVEQTDQRNGTVTLAFSVSDTGEGIPESKRDDIFEQHMQVDSDASGSGKGLGLGLSICLNLVDMMDGEMDVESEVGEGTTFTFTIDLQEAKRTEQGEGTPSVALDDVNVLIVEDNAMVRKVFRTYLTSHDITVVECETGEDALDELKDEHGTSYDVVFLDRRLDDMSGVEVLEEVADDDDAIDTDRIFMVSGDPAGKVRQRIEPRSCGGVMEKPVDESSLINAVSSVVGSQRQQGDQEEIEELQANIRSTTPDPFHILVADDDSNTRTLMNELLAPVADDLTFVQNGKEAVEGRFEDSPDLLFMDLQMPEMNGLEATESIRQKEAEQGIPPVSIIAQTARAMKHVETECLEAGADLFIRKPIRRRRLYHAILDVI